MDSKRKKVAVGVACAAVATIALAASVPSKLNDLVVVGTGAATNKSVTFDTGHGGTNSLIQAPSGGGLKLSANGSALMTVPPSTDTLVGRATSDLLTNKSMIIADSDFSITNSGHSLFFDGSALTSNRTLHAQDASGNIALTSQVPLNCNYYSSTDSSGSSVFVAVTCGGGSVLAGWCSGTSAGGHLYNSALTNCSGSGGATRCTTQHCDWENAGGTLTATAVCCTY